MTPIYCEDGRSTPLVDGTDVLVCGGGPAGIAAAIAAARTGAETTVLEGQGCLGGVWTSGILACVLEAGKPGIITELRHRLDALDPPEPNGDGFIYDIESMKLVLDRMIVEAGVRVQLHTNIVGAERDGDGRVGHVITESKSGRQAWPARVIIDATGDGDVAARAGCGFDYGHPATGQAQPMTLMALITGLRLPDVDPFVAGGAELERSPSLEPRDRYRPAIGALLGEFAKAEVVPSYRAPSLWAIKEDVYALMANHQYNVSPFDASEITRATMDAREELHQLVDALRSLGGVWKGIRLVATANQIGVREARRIHGRYEVTLDDLRTGARHPDAVCRVTNGADVHALSAEEGGYLSPTTSVLQDEKRACDEVAPSQPYDIPLRALIARDVDGLMMAGRCISGDFFAHSSYRITGNAVSMGQGAGVAAALAALSNTLPQDVPWASIADCIETINASGVVSVAGRRS